ncbi:MAG: hypothetical protein ACLVKO_01985 [Dysgonomonas sp.]
MPRRKKHVLKGRELEIYRSLVEELSQNPELADYDMNTIEITLLKNLTPQIRNIDKAIANLKRYIAINGKNITIINGEPSVFKRDIIKMMKISRPTLDKWIKDGNITPQHSSFFQKNIFPPKLILEQLEAYKQANKSCKPEK